MCLRFYSNSISVPIKNVCFWLIIFMLVVGCRTSGWFPAQDCDVVKDLEIRGVVQTTNGTPIPDANITIRSKRQLQCPNSVPIDDIVLISDAQGQFSYTLPYIAEDDTLEVEVTVEGYEDYIIEYATYADFRDIFTIVLW